MCRLLATHICPYARTYLLPFTHVPMYLHSFSHPYVHHLFFHTLTRTNISVHMHACCTLTSAVIKKPVAPTRKAAVFFGEGAVPPHRVLGGSCLTAVVPSATEEKLTMADLVSD